MSPAITGTGPWRALALWAGLWVPLVAASCTGEPDLVGSVIHQDVSGLDAGALQAPADAAMDMCDPTDLIGSSPDYLRLLSHIVLKNCQFPYSWLRTGPTELDIDESEVDAFLAAIEDLGPMPPRPGAVPEEPCNPLLGGWGFRTDDPFNPSSIILCEATCNLVRDIVAREVDQLVMECEQGGASTDAGPPSQAGITADDDAGS